jgi:chitin disaccharide deacetylase
VLFPDHFDNSWRAGSRERVLAEIAALAPGVSEIHVQPAIDTPEVRAISSDASGWVDDLDLVMDPMLRERLDDVGAIPIGYREVRDLMRRESSAPSH